MPKPFELARPQLEAQYLDVKFDPASGLSKKELVTELERHRAANPGEPRILTKAWLLNLLCAKSRLAPEPNDYFVGKLEHHDLLIKLRNEWWKTEGDREFNNDPPVVSGTCTAQLDCASHICPDWRNFLKYGFTGLRDRAAARPGVFYESVAMTFDAAITLIKRFNTAQPSPVLAALAERPPRTFHEALQMAYIYHDLMELDGIAVRSMGRFDLLYNNFFVNDLKDGRLTRDQAKELLKYFWIKFFAKHQGKHYGKPFLYGPDANDLSCLAFEVFREMQIVDPKFHVRLA